MDFGSSSALFLRTNNVHVRKHLSLCIQLRIICAFPKSYVLESGTKFRLVNTAAARRIIRPGLKLLGVRAPARLADRLRQVQLIFSACSASLQLSCFGVKYAYSRTAISIRPARIYMRVYYVMFWKQDCVTKSSHLTLVGSGCLYACKALTLCLLSWLDLQLNSMMT